MGRYHEINRECLVRKTSSKRKHCLGRSAEFRQAVEIKGGLSLNVVTRINKDRLYYEETVFKTLNYNYYLIV